VLLKTRDTFSFTSLKKSTKAVVSDSIRDLTFTERIQVRAVTKDNLEEICLLGYNAV
jgi:hypothetical protein